MTRPKYRETRCDHCEKVRKDCIWITRVSTKVEYCLCGECRAYWRSRGETLTNADPDFAAVSL